MQKKLEGKLLKKILTYLEKESPKLYAELKGDPEGDIYITRINPGSTYSADIPEKMIAFFRGGFLDVGVIDGKKVYLPSINDFCIIYKINVDLIEIWRKEYKEMAYAIKIADMIIENILQNEVLSARNSSGALAILKARVGGKWKDEKETKNHTFNILLGNLGDVQGLSPRVSTPELASANPIESEAKALVDPKTFDRVISVETSVDVIGDSARERIKENTDNLHKGREQAYIKELNSRSEKVKERSKKKIMAEVREFLDA